MWLVSKCPVGGNLPFQLRPGKFLLGRSRSCDIQVFDLSVSRRHASLVVDASRTAKLQDLGSRNGIKLNGNAVITLRLGVGDEFRIGAVRLSVQMKPTRSLDVLESDEDSTSPLGKSEQHKTIRIDAVALTPAEHQVLNLAITGLSEKEIANELHCTYYTVHTHFKAIYKKMGVHTRAELHAHLPAPGRRKKM